MNLHSTMDMMAGGQGSGCRGQNCGRPKLAGRTEWNGLKISIEHKKGDIRSKVSKTTGNRWSMRMKNDYGYFLKTIAHDGDKLDVLIGPDKNAKNVYVVHQLKRDGKTFDEDKPIIGAKSLDHAMEMYHNYARPGQQIKGVSTWTAEEFKQKLLTGKCCKQGDLKAMSYVEAKGTSEGVRKEWDTRGRGRKKHDPKHKVFNKALGKIDELKEFVMEDPHDDLPNAHTVQLEKDLKKAKSELDAWKSRLDRAHDKMEDIHATKSLWGKAIHILHQFGQYSQSVREIATWLASAVILGRGVANAQVTHQLINTIYMHLHPIITAVNQMGIFAEDDVEAQRSTLSLTNKPKRVGIPKPMVAEPRKIPYAKPRVANIGKYPTVPKPRMPHLGKTFTPKTGGGFGGTTGIGKKSFGRMDGWGDWGEPMAGGMSHAHIDPVSWFHPPSLTKRHPNEETRIPADNPREDNDKFLDKTKRNSKDTEEFKMKMLKRGGPGGLPPQVPVRTTLVAPNTAAYMPSGILMGAAMRRRRLDGKGGNSTAYGRRGCI